MPVQRPLKVNLILHPENRGWIIEKMTLRLQEHLQSHDVSASISDRSRADVDLNHWMSYAFANERPPTRATMFITHIDDPYKAAQVKRELANGIDIGICMSSGSVEQLVSLGVPAKALCYVLPAYDGAVRPRRVRIGITTRIYPDGRKREQLLVRLASRLPLDTFQFIIFGQGWEKVIPSLQAAGAEVTYFPGGEDYEADYRRLLEHLPQFDYYLYTGMDEGSLGTLDALAAGVKTIVTAQGFHLDLRPAITHLFVSYEELESIFRGIDAETKVRTQMAAQLTWSAYAARHSEVWRALLQSAEQVGASPLASASPRSVPAPPRSVPVGRGFWWRALSPRRVLSAIGRVPQLQGLRSAWRGHQRR